MINSMRVGPSGFTIVDNFELEVLTREGNQQLRHILKETLNWDPCSRLRIDQIQEKLQLIRHKERTYKLSPIEIPLNQTATQKFNFTTSLS